MKADFQYINELVFEFLSQKEIAKSLDLIDKQEISGWEIWFQVEFSKFLSGHNSEPVWGRELSFEFDYRKERERGFFKPDFLIRKKGWRKESYTALEVKQHRNAATCIANMMKDLVKVSKIRASELDLRTYWALGLFQTEPTQDPWQLIYEKSNLTNVEIIRPCCVVQPIKGTNYTYALF